MLVSQILDSKGHAVATIATTAPLSDAVRALAEQRIGALVVSDDGDHILGILSERDIVRVLGESGPAALDHAISRVMTDVVTCTTADRDLNDLMAVMTEKRIRHVPVVDEDNRLRGIVSIGDAVKSRLGELEGEREALIGYITTGG